MSTLGLINLVLEEASGNVFGHLRPDRWHLDYLCVSDTQAFSSIGGIFAVGGELTDVYILSTGINHQHELLEGRTHDLPGFTNEDTVGNGTAIACTVGGRTLGVARKCQMYIAKVTDGEGTLQQNLFEGAVDEVIQHHQGKVGRSSVVYVDIAIAPTLEDRVVVAPGGGDFIEVSIKKLLNINLSVIVPAGDGFRSEIETLGTINTMVVRPARMKGVIAIGSLGHNNRPSLFTGYGEGVLAYAPGEGIVTGGTNGSEIVGVDSTRMSAALVTGITAMYLSRFPMHSNSQVKDFITRYFISDEIEGLPDDAIGNDPFLNVTAERPVYMSLVYDNGLPLDYISNPRTNNQRAYAYFIKSNLEILTESDLGVVTGMYYFSIPIEAQSVTRYGEHKDLEFKLLESNASFITVGKNTGLVFGTAPEVSTNTVYILKVSISDGTYTLIQDFTLTVQPLAETVLYLTGSTKAEKEGVYYLNLKSPSKTYYPGITLNLTEPSPVPSKVVIPIRKHIYLFDRDDGLAAGHQVSNETDGSFRMMAKTGMYQVVSVDYDLTSVDENAQITDKVKVN